jgi:hypothetical protein
VVFKPLPCCYSPDPNVRCDKKLCESELGELEIVGYKNINKMSLYVKSFK